MSGSGINLQDFSVQPILVNGKFLFLLIARLLRDKGIYEFVEAARRIRKKRRDVIFKILGGLEPMRHASEIKREEVYEWIDEGVVEYLGEVDDIKPFVSGADCVVLPSYREGLSRVLLEAGAMGRPMISTDVPGCREVVLDGENGYLCQARNTNDLVRVMEKMLLTTVNERKVMGSRSRRIVEEKFDERNVIEAYLDAIHS